MEDGLPKPGLAAGRGAIGVCPGAQQAQPDDVAQQFGVFHVGGVCRGMVELRADLQQRGQVTDLALLVRAQPRKQRIAVGAVAFVLKVQHTGNGGLIGGAQVG